MDVKTARRRNLALLERRAESLAEIERLTAQALGEEDRVRASYLSQVKGGRGMGDQIARRLERWLGVETGWMDRHQDPAAFVLSEDRRVHYLVNEPAEFPLRSGGVDLAQLDVRGSMGTGIAMPERETVIDMIRVPADYIRENFPNITSPANLKIITGYGDSMKGTFNHNDPLIIDTGVNTMDIDAIYVFAYENELYIKRIQRMPDRSIKVISDNRAVYDPWVLTAKQRENVHTIARVLVAVNMNKLA